MQEEQPQQPDSNQAPASQSESQWSFHQEETGAANSQPTPAQHNSHVEWSASEFVAHEKGAGWFLLLGLVIVVIGGLVYWLTEDRLSMVMIGVIGVAFGIFAARQPRVLTYRIDQSGLSVGDKLYTYDKFKSFAVVEEGAFHSILLMPLKRFMPALTIYYEPNDENKILETLGDYLPFEHRRLDAIDRMMSRIRF